MESDSGPVIEVDQWRDQVTQQTGEEARQGIHQYSEDEVRAAVEAIQLLIRVRDRCRKRGLIAW